MVLKNSKMKNCMNINFIVYAYRYHDDSGGIVVLHKLCHLLNQNGYKASLWPNYKPIFDKENIVKSIFQFLKYFRKSVHRKFATNKLWNTPIASYKDLQDENSIVIYAELVDGNPLNAKNVVRWLLHKPGFHSNKINYSKNELVFYYLKSYVDNLTNINMKNELYIANNREETYFDKKLDNREGTCYILRKGKDRKIVHDLNNSILIDGKSHQEIAEIFNRTEMCISYDTYTMYSVYAAMCGCISVVVPEEGVLEEEWLPDPKTRYGIAYGFDKIEESKKTQQKLLERMEEESKTLAISLSYFVDECSKVFFTDSNS